MYTGELTVAHTGPFKKDGHDFHRVPLYKGPFWASILLSVSVSLLEVLYTIYNLEFGTQCPMVRVLELREGKAKTMIARMNFKPQ